MMEISHQNSTQNQCAFAMAIKIKNAKRQPLTF